MNSLVESQTSLKKRVSKFALASLGLGIIYPIFIVILHILKVMNNISVNLELGLFGIMSLAGLLCGIIALKKIGKNGNYKGKGLAISGIVVSSMIFLIFVYALFTLAFTYIFLRTVL
jgi:hypothetical protein